MKTYNNLYGEITDFSNLLLAWRKSRRGKRYTTTAADFELRLDTELTEIQQELQSATYQPGTYRSFTIHEPKRRKISAAPPDTITSTTIASLLAFPQLFQSLDTYR